MTQPEETMTEEALAALVLSSVLAPWLAMVYPVVMAFPTPDVSAILRFDTEFNRLIDRLMPVLARLARPGWARTNDQLGTRALFDPNDPELRDLLSQTRNLLVGIPHRVYREVIRSLADGRDRGEDQGQLRARVDRVLDINGATNWPNRALVIARTERNRFTEAGALAAARRIQQSERRRVRKLWQDRDDDRVRRAHARVDNQLRQLGEAFHVGRSRLQHPLDPSGFPEDVIDCRCELEFVRLDHG
jgi:hypothetical protein